MSTAWKLTEKYELKVPLAIGTMLWGMTCFDEYLSGSLVSNEKIINILNICKENSIQAIDTAEGYGDGTSEERLGQLLLNQQHNNNNSNFFVITKFLPTFWRCTEWQFNASLEASRKRLNVNSIPLYFLHSPVHPFPLEYWIRLFVKAKNDGRIQGIGLSNCDADQVQRAIQVAKPTKIDSIQIHFSLLCSNSIQLQRLIKLCKEENISILGFSAIAQGLLSDNLSDIKFNESRIAKISRITRTNLQPLRDRISEISSKRGVTMAQVAINYSICKGVIPLVGVRKPEHCLDAIAATKWRLSMEEIISLDELALNLSTFEKPRWKRSLSMIIIASLVVFYRVERILVFLRILKRPTL